MNPIIHRIRSYLQLTRKVYDYLVGVLVRKTNFNLSETAQVGTIIPKNIKTNKTVNFIASASLVLDTVTIHPY
jgi:hypothetical protein